MAGGAFSFVGAIELLKRLGMFDIILPIILVYAVVFGVLQRSSMFTRKNAKGETIAHKELNATIAFIIALLVIGAANITGVIQKFMPFVGLISVLAVSFLMLVGLITGDLGELLKDKNLGTPLKGILIIMTAIAFMFTFGMAAGWWDLSIAQGIMLSGEGLFTAENVSAIIFLLIIIGVIAWISNSSKNA